MGLTLSVVIVSWNTRQLVLDCLNSLENCRLHMAMEVILVDNASADDTVECVRKQFPNTLIIQNSENLGFARANNLGLQASSGEFIALINSDVQVPNGSLEKMVSYMKENRDIGMLGPKMILRDGTTGQSCYRYPTVGRWFTEALSLSTILNKTAGFGDFKMSDFKHDRTMEVDVLTGWFWLVRREAIQQIGLLDTQFFMYGEDIDWPKRFHDGKWKVVFYSEANAIHYCGASSDRAPVRFYVEMNRANLQYFRKHHNIIGVIGFWIAIWLHQTLRLIGYSLVFAVQKRRREIAAHKVKRSAACLLWLVGLKTGSEVA
ncbi:MAG TPA: glycosyltransferase family 2 protein [Candidatus Acidoferrum sp.]|jgi:GT2 family glycosyltransferase|nr:glycosyltransferase family 2 protein [Candidatus Acidoferrum sp.]